MAFAEVLLAHGELLVIFIYCVVGQVPIQIVGILLVGLLEQLGCESGKPIFEHEEAEGLDTGH